MFFSFTYSLARRAGSSDTTTSILLERSVHIEKVQGDNNFEEWGRETHVCSQRPLPLRRENALPGLGNLPTLIGFPRQDARTAPPQNDDANGKIKRFTKRR